MSVKISSYTIRREANAGFTIDTLFHPTSDGNVQLEYPAILIDAIGSKELSVYSLPDLEAIGMVEEEARYDPVFPLSRFEHDGLHSLLAGRNIHFYDSRGNNDLVAEVISRFERDALIAEGTGTEEIHRMLLDHLVQAGVINASSLPEAPKATRSTAETVTIKVTTETGFQNAKHVDYLEFERADWDRMSETKREEEIMEIGMSMITITASIVDEEDNLTGEDV